MALLLDVLIGVKKKDPSCQLSCWIFESLSSLGQDLWKRTWILPCPVSYDRTPNSTSSMIFQPSFDFFDEMWGLSRCPSGRNLIQKFLLFRNIEFALSGNILKKIKEAWINSQDSFSKVNPNLQILCESCRNFYWHIDLRKIYQSKVIKHFFHGLFTLYGVKIHHLALRTFLWWVMPPWPQSISLKKCFPFPQH